MRTSWLWLYGPPGVGKSAIGFELFEQLIERDERVGFVELDQVGMCMSTAASSRSAAKADNLLGMLDNFAAAGVDGVIVSGDIAETMSEVLTRAHAPPVLCRLRADDDVTIERLAARGGLQYAMSSSAYESNGVPSGDLDITTHPLSVDEVAAEILRRLGPWPPASTGAGGPLAPPVLEDASAILVTGPRAVGTSTVAWQVLGASIESGYCTGYLDLDQLGFTPAARQELSLATKLANVATCWAGFRNQGAERLVLCGHVDGHEVTAVRDLVPSLLVVALTAAAQTLLSRARRRSRQKDIWLPGDDLFRCDDDHLREVVLQAATFDPSHADLVINTDDLTPADITAGIARHWDAATA